MACRQGYDGKVQHLQGFCGEEPGLGRPQAEVRATGIEYVLTAFAAYCHGSAQSVAIPAFDFAAADNVIGCIGKEVGE